MATPKEVLEFARQNGTKVLDLRFTDIPGLWHRSEERRVGKECRL